MARYQQYVEYKDSGVEWLGEIPSDWKVASLRFLVEAVSNGSTASQVEESETTVPISRIESISTGEIDMNKVGFVDIKSISSNFKLHKNDILLSHINSLPMVGNIALKRDNSTLFHGMNLLRLVPNRTITAPSYLFWLLKSIYFRKTVESVAKPAINQASVSIDSLKNINLLVPKIDEQIAIANFLDHETTQIDHLIEKHQQLIKLLKEKRQAVISHAVTKGLDPNVPMKDSGVEWLGEVPEHWDITPIRNLIRSGNLVLQDGNHGELHPTANDYVETGIPFLMANNIRNGSLLMEDVKKIPKYLADKLRIGFAKAGDMLLTHKGTVGEVALVPQDIKEDYWMLTPQVTYYRWQGKNFLNKYFYYQFQSSSIQNQLEIIGGKQSTRAYVGLIAQGDLIAVIPPLHEQLEIASYILDKDQSYQLMIVNAESAIQLMQERRTALITAAVTGKIDVRNWQSPTVSEAETEFSA